LGGEKKRLGKKHEKVIRAAGRTENKRPVRELRQMKDPLGKRGYGVRVIRTKKKQEKKKRN